MYEKAAQTNTIKQTELPAILSEFIDANERTEKILPVISVI